MSIVVYLKNKNKCIMCADTQTSCGDEKLIRTQKNNLKISLLKNGLTVGHVGVLNTTEWILANEQWFEFDDKLNKNQIIKKIIPKIIKGLSEASLLIEDKNGLCAMECSLLLAHKNKAFVIYGDFSVYEINNYVAIGSGANFCLPYLNELPTENLGKYLFEMLIENCQHNCSISPPFVSINTSTPSKINLSYSKELRI